MILGLGDSELAADIPGEQQPLGTNGRVQAAERVRVMPLNVAGHALGRTPVLGLELDLLTASTRTAWCHWLQSMGPTGSCLGPGNPNSNDFSGLQHRR
jgi:hypothetical protein